MLTIRKILYPTDFSECANSALRWALLLSKYFAANLDMLHISSKDFKKEDQDILDYFPDQKACENMLIHAADSGLERSGEREDSLSIKQVIKHGSSISQEVMDYAALENMDLIVMGTHGRAGLRHLLLGSVAEQLVQKAPCPLITIRERRAREKVAIKRIVLPIDFSEYCQLAARYAVVLAKLTGARLHVLHVLDPAAEDCHAESIDGVNREQLNTNIDEFMSDCQVLIDYTVHVKVGKPDKQIIEFADEESNALIIIASQGAGQSGSLRFGSTTDRVVRSAFSPVLTVKLQERQFVK